MSFLHLSVHADVLKIRLNPDQRTSSDRLVQDAIRQLDRLLATGELAPAALLKLDGPVPLPVCGAVIHKLTPLYRAIAIYDPKLGKPGYNTYIVAATQDSAYSYGDRIEVPTPAVTQTGLKIVLCGPKQSGKTCLRQGLKLAIQRIPNAPYPYIITACPDGEGSWFSDVAQRDPHLARQLKDEYKARFTPAFADLAAQWVANANQPLQLIDVGGKISPENRLIMAAASHAVILASDRQAMPAWVDFCTALNLTIIAKIHSHYHAHQDEIDPNPTLLTGQVHYLERGVDVSHRPMIQALAQRIVQLAHLHYSP